MIAILCIFSLFTSLSLVSAQCVPDGMMNCEGDVCWDTRDARWEADKLMMKSRASFDADITGQTANKVLSGSNQPYWTGNTNKDSCNNECYVCLNILNTKETSAPAESSNYDSCAVAPSGSGLIKGNQLHVAGIDYDYRGFALWDGVLYHSYDDFSGATKDSGKGLLRCVKFATKYDETKDSETIPNTETLDPFAGETTSGDCAAIFPFPTAAMLKGKTIKGTINGFNIEFTLQGSDVKIYIPSRTMEYKIEGTTDRYFIDSVGIMVAQGGKVCDSQTTEKPASTSSGTSGPVPAGKPSSKGDVKGDCRVDLLVDVNKGSVSDQSTLKSYVEIVKENNYDAIFAYIFTSVDGTVATNLKVSEARIKSIAADIKKIDSSIAVVPGHTFPGATTGPETNWFGSKTQNRRVILTTKSIPPSEYLPAPSVGKITKDECVKNAPDPNGKTDKDSKLDQEGKLDKDGKPIDPGKEDKTDSSTGFGNLGKLKWFLPLLFVILLAIYKFLKNRRIDLLDPNPQKRLEDYEKDVDEEARSLLDNFRSKRDLAHHVYDHMNKIDDKVGEFTPPPAAPEPTVSTPTASASTVSAQPATPASPKTPKRKSPPPLPKKQTAPKKTAPKPDDFSNMPGELHKEEGRF